MMNTMKKFFLLIFIMLISSYIYSQEVVVFKDDRSLIVRSHRESGNFIILSLDGGEIGVSKSQIKEIRNENTLKDYEKISVEKTKEQNGYYQEPKPIPNRQLFLNPALRNPSQTAQAGNKVEPEEDEENDIEESDVDEEDDEEEAPPPTTQQPQQIAPPRVGQLPQLPSQGGKTLSPIIRKR